MRASTTALAVLLFASACAPARPFVADELAPFRHAEPRQEASLAHRVILAGALLDGSDSASGDTFVLLRQTLLEAGENATFVDLGDLKGPGERVDTETYRRLLEGFRGQTILTPGERDWAAGIASLNDLERTLEAALGGGDTVLPSGGAPGPEVIEVSDDLVLIVLGTGWWMYPRAKLFGEMDGYDLTERGDVLVRMNELIRKYDDERVVVIGHHPVFSNGRYGGRYPLSDHLFPLRRAIPGAYVPLPGLGTLPILARSYLGTSRRDLSHHDYQRLSRALTDIFQQHESLVYASAHERNVQYFRKATPGGEQQHYLISGGAGGAHEFAARGWEAAFTAARAGFMVVRYLDDGSAYLDVLSPADGGVRADTLLSVELHDAFPEAIVAEISPEVAARAPRIAPDSVQTRAPGPGYDVGPFRRTLVGPGWRKDWITPVDIPVLDMSTFAGGLSVIKRGGGMQTKSLRLRGENGYDYAMRSVDKDPFSSLPKAFQYDLAGDIAQDLTSAIHPYAAFAIPRLAEAAGIPHTEPRLVVVPDDPRLGRYREEFAGEVMMIEIRPDEDMSELDRFGNATNVIGDTKLYRELDDDNDHRVDQLAFARARLFDIWIGDWDRHKGQWRWGAYEPYELDPTLEGDARKDGKIYRPIPRDRDWAFNDRDGILFRAGRKHFPKIQGLQDDYTNLVGYTTNGALQDIRFLNAVTRDQWRAIAEDLRANLTDAVIDEAIATWPESARRQSGTEVARRLKLRRDKIVDVADRFYLQNAGAPTIVGSHKHERFEVTRETDGATRVVVWKIRKDGEKRKVIYDRTFDPKETEEIRLYGYAGDDQFVVEGMGERGILVIADGGTGDDTFEDRSYVDGRKRLTHFYDTGINPRNTFVTSRETKIYRTDRYPERAYQYPLPKLDEWVPLAQFDVNSGDGLFVGVGVRWMQHAYGRMPYSRRHFGSVVASPTTLAFTVRYDGTYLNTLGDTWDTGLSLRINSPNSFRNFYGLGNETEDVIATREYYRARLGAIDVAPRVAYRFGPRAHFETGPIGRVYRLREDDDRFVTQPQAGVSEQLFGTLGFAGARALLDLDGRDSRVQPRRGFRSTIEAEALAGVSGGAESYGRFEGAVTLYKTFPGALDRATLAYRIGGGHLVGEFPFFEATTLGSADNLRGYRSTRFAGRSSLYQNAELRVGVRPFNTYLARGTLGVLGFVDAGRVWADGEPDGPFFESLHLGYGGGIWANALDLFVARAVVGFSEETTSVTVGLGFLY